MTHRVVLLLQLFLLSLHESSLRQLVTLKLQEVCVLTVALNTLFECLQFLAHMLVLAEDFLVFGQLLVVFGDNVKYS